MMEGRVKVVDNFCDEIDFVIESVKAAGFGTWRPNKGEVGSSIYDGMGFWGAHALMLRALIGVTGHVLVPNSMFFRGTTVDMEKAYIHSDRETGAYTCVVYLSDHDEGYGTAFYRHRPTGLVEMPSFAEMKELGIMDDLSEDMVSRDDQKWDFLGAVQGKKNRAVIFEAPLFHSRYPITGIGTDPASSRLVWVSHFYKLAGDGSLS